MTACKTLRCVGYGLGSALVLGLGAASAPKRVSKAPRLVDLQRIDARIRVDLSYSRPGNRFGRRLYSGDVALLREPVARRLARVQKRLRRHSLGLKVWDAYRPTSVQRAMFRLKPGTRYLTNPRKGSNHSRGAAVDVTLCDSSGKELSMPTPHDEFSPRAHRGATRGISEPARRHARLLDAVMRAEGFTPVRYEWWHFNAPDARRYPLANVPVPRGK
jgi:zinc D-Ala-D-Ala dipeptidase